jgi:hypothetical protein
MKLKTSIFLFTFGFCGSLKVIWSQQKIILSKDLNIFETENFPLICQKSIGIDPDQGPHLCQKVSRRSH